MLNTTHWSDNVSCCRNWNLICGVICYVLMMSDWLLSNQVQPKVKNCYVIIIRGVQWWERVLFINLCDLLMIRHANVNVVYSKWTVVFVPQQSERMWSRRHRHLSTVVWAGDPERVKADRVSIEVYSNCTNSLCSRSVYTHTYSQLQVQITHFKTKLTLSVI